MCCCDAAAKAVSISALWGPLLLFTAGVEFSTYNVDDAALRVELKSDRLAVQLAELPLHETKGVILDESNPTSAAETLFVDALQDECSELYRQFEDYRQFDRFWGRRDVTADQVQSVAIGKYPSEMWRATTHVPECNPWELILGRPGQPHA